MCKPEVARIHPLAPPSVLVMSQRPCPLPFHATIRWCERVQEGFDYLQNQEVQGAQEVREVEGAKAFDLIILDASLPRRDALQALGQLRRMGHTSVMLRRRPR